MAFLAVSPTWPGHGQWAGLPQLGARLVKGADRAHMAHGLFWPKVQQLLRWHSKLASRSQKLHRRYHLPLMYPKLLPQLVTVQMGEII